MAILKRQSYIRDTGITDPVAYDLYLLNARPLRASESQEDRNKEITKILKEQALCQCTGKDRR